eukprot:4331699-Amphidinium_carterae.1
MFHHDMIMPCVSQHEQERTSTMLCRDNTRQTRSKQINSHKWRLDVHALNGTILATAGTR